MNFSDIKGQRDILSSLLNVLRHDKTGHAYIFTGPEGIGKRTVAKAFAKALLCTGGSETGCDRCTACKLMNSESNPDFRMIDNGNNTVSVDIIREMREDMFLMPTHSARKVYVIANAHNMTVQAQNSMLKIFENPPSYAVVILTTPRYRELAETIRSRAITFHFRRNTDQEVYEALKEYGGNIENIDFLTAYAQGIIGKALSMAASPELNGKRERLFKIIAGGCEDRISFLRDSMNFFSDNRNDAELLLDIMQTVYRDAINVLISTRKDKLINTDKKDIILNMASMHTVAGLIKKIEIIEDTKIKLRNNVNYELAIEVMLLELQEV